MEGASFWSIAFTVLCCVIFFAHRKAITLSTGIKLVICIGFFLSWGYVTIMNNQSQISGEATVATGKIIETPTFADNRYRFVTRLGNGEKVQMFLESSDFLPKLTYGSECNFEGEYELPSSMQNHYGFDYRRFLREQSIHWVFRVNPASSFQCNPPGFSLRRTLLSFRESGIKQLDQLYQQERDAQSIAVIRALVFGDRSSITEEHRVAYQTIGVSHLLAVSGLHVGLISFLIIVALQRFGMTKESSRLSLFLFLPVYIILAGGAPSVIRASSMVMVVIGASFFNTKVKPVNGICMVFMLLLIWDPYFIYHLGFQLSFLTSFVLLTSGRILTRTDRTLSTIFRVTCLAQLASFPIVIYHFYEISLLSLPFNILFIPMISFWVLPLSLIIVLILPAFPLLAEWLFQGVSLPLYYTHELMLFLNGFSSVRLSFGQPSFLMILLLFGSIFVFIFVWESKGIQYQFLAFMSVVVLMVSQMVYPYLSGYGAVTMLNVGQGDATLIELPYRDRVYLIDTGGLVFWGEDVTLSGPGERVILPHLAAKGIQTIDKLIITHGHADHFGETCMLIEQVTVKKVLYPIGGMESELEKEVRGCLNDQEIPIIEVSEGMKWNVGAIPFKILSPNGTETSENDRSIVLQTVLGERSWLFTGDIEEEAEKRIVKDHPTLQADVLKVPHHGSRTSSREEFLALVDPKIALISVGRNNRFGHPNEEVLDRLKYTDVFRTDLHGDITIRFHDKKRIWELMMTEEN
ncbi:DNA internalization-related competence protein ComEC/Rec2 [Alteribacter populi]|uniref:DNA internalization-related competence protein ComEC/Rec2 n=1 Tax=Alteribacter populi TaxID=2011011 RepID=UPI001E4C05C9|nr:DNA internalization-related competence protein ComEC/Rec2 [Alteribacter populi]